MEARMEALSLLDDEEEELVLEVGQEGKQDNCHELCLVGRFLTNRNINFAVMKNRMASLWRPGKGICIKEITSQLFLFQLFYIVDLKRVFEGGPWTFDNHLLIVHCLQGGEVPARVLLFHVEFWIQVYDLLVGYMSVNVGRQLGNFIGEFIEYDNSNNISYWRNYMRIRVRIDVRKSLKRWKRIRKLDKFCDKLFSTPPEAIKKEWESWLKAPIRRLNNNGGDRWLRDDKAILEVEGDELTNQDVWGERDLAKSKAMIIGKNYGKNGEWQKANLEGMSENIQQNTKGKSTYNVLERFEVNAEASQGADTGLEDDGLEIQEDRKRRHAGLGVENRGGELKMEYDKQEVTEKGQENREDGYTTGRENFLSAEPGVQACRPS